MMQIDPRGHAEADLGFRILLTRRSRRADEVRVNEREKREKEEEKEKKKHCNFSITLDPPFVAPSIEHLLHFSKLKSKNMIFRPAPRRARVQVPLQFYFTSFSLCEYLVYILC